MHEPLVTLEQAILLKELGFDWKVNFWRFYKNPDYLGQGEVSKKYACHDWNNREAVRDIRFSAPTLSLAAQWLRGKGLHVVALPSTKWINTFDFKVYMIREDGSWYIESSGYFNQKDHDAAYSAGISDALTILKNREI